MPEITIIDDEIQLAEMLAEVAEICGYEAVIYTDAREFLKHEIKTDVIFLDLTMPDIDGIEVISELGKRQNTAVIVLMSGFDQSLLQTSQVLAEKWGLNVIEPLTKPMSIKVISQVLESIKETL